MKERPILFSGPMVRAILEGRKTQTRRIVKGDGMKSTHKRVAGGYVGTIEPAPCPFGEPGDRLWVKEGIRRGPPSQIAGDDGGPFDTAEFIADGTPTNLDTWAWKLKALPGMYLPRGLSRITLKVTGVRVERLQDITEEDAKTEGVDAAPFCKAGRANGLEHVEAFEALWDKINGKRANWASNPWVWVVSFRRYEPGGGVGMAPRSERATQ